MKIQVRSWSFLCSVALLGVVAAVPIVAAQQTGDVLTVLLPSSGAQPEPNPDPS
jgi:hypothetical protein